MCVEIVQILHFYVFIANGVSNGNLNRDTGSRQIQQAHLSWTSNNPAYEPCSSALALTFECGNTEERELRRCLAV